MSGDYTVKEGDCVSSIAFEHGFFWETLWNHSNNAQLKQKRKNPNMLKPGDVIHVPDLTPNEQGRATDKRHPFRLKGAPVKLRLRIMEIPRSNPTERTSEPDKSANEGRGAPGQTQPSRGPQKEEPRSALPYILVIEGKLFQDQTTSDGMIEYDIPPNARDGKLILGPGTPGEFTILLRIGCLEPVEEIAGAQARLNNLGFTCGAVDGILGPRTKAALQRFQDSNGLTTSGELDQATKSRLGEAHDSK